MWARRKASKKPFTTPKTRQQQNHVFLDLVKCCFFFFHRVFLNLAVSQPSRFSLLKNRVKNRVKRDFTRFLTSLNAVFLFFTEPLVLSPKNRVNSKITCFLTSLSVTSRQLPSKNKNFKNSKNPYPDCVLPPFYRLKPFESDGTMCAVNGRGTETQPPQGFTP